MLVSMQLQLICRAWMDALTQYVLPLNGIVLSLAVSFLQVVHVEVCRVDKQRRSNQP